MFKLETGIGKAIDNVPKEEKIKDKKIEDEDSFEDFKRELKTEENLELSSVENKKPITSRLKKAVYAITAGVMLLSATPAFAQEKGKQLTEKQKIELRIQELQEQKMQLERQESEVRHAERMRELNGYLDYFNIDGLKLGEAKVKVRRPCEQFGVYIKEKHLGDIYSKKSLTFSHQEFVEDVTKVLKENGIQFGTKLSKPQRPEAVDAEVNINTAAKKILKDWGGFVDLKGSTINIGGPDEITFDKYTKRIDIVSVGNDMLVITCEDYDGKRTVVTCINKMVKNISEIK